MNVYADIFTALEAFTVLFGLLTVRFGVLVQMVPFLGGKATPQPVKLAIALALSLIVLPSVWSTYLANPPGPTLIAVYAMKEALIGLTLGFVTALVFDAVRIAGQIIDTARGQNLATALVPQLPDRVSITAVLYYQLAVVIFLLSGGHLLFYSALVDTFQAFPLLGFPEFQTEAMMMVIVRWFGDSMLFAVQLAIPVIAAILLADMVLALINKAAPQIQVFFLGMPAKAMLGILVVLLTLSAAIETFWLDTALSEIGQIPDLLLGVQ